MIRMLVTTFIASMLIGPATAVSATSHGATTMELVQGMDTFCQQAMSDSIALGHPMTGELKKLCDY